MKKTQTFEDLIIWKSSKDLTISIYKLFQLSKDFGIKDQIQRASLSIMNNIAEGYERETDKEFIRFLYIAKGSCGEVLSIVILYKELGILDSIVANEIMVNCKTLSTGIYNLIKYLRNKNNGKNKNC